MTERLDLILAQLESLGPALRRATGDYADAGRDSARALASIFPPITPPAPAAVLPVSGLPAALPAPACPPADGAGGALYHEETT